MLTTSRVERAKELLKSGAAAAEVGVSVGFVSTSTFYENFRRRTGIPPAQFARLGQSFSIDLPCNFAPQPVLAMLGRDPASASERACGNEFDIALWSGVSPCLVRGLIEGNRVQVCIEGAGAVPQDVHAQLSRLLGLEQDPRPFEEHVKSIGLGRLVEGREGTRIPQTPTVFDGFVWCIVGQQVNLPFAYALRRRLTELVGNRVGSLFAPPTAGQVARLSVEELLPLQFSRRKAEYLIGVARSISDGSLNPEELASATKADLEKRLLELRGIGPWAANYLMMRSFGSADCVPLGDTGLTSALARFFNVERPDVDRTRELMETFRPFRSLATYHLWRSLHGEI
jgi:AraC family transcriptional regulator of adaptative response / DNA-3-methyladenine glycosylase II